uniref:Uncharacterized protein n=1 Tax=Trichuris muris TaxID=70415 RepID=A0A5S6Q767_TRIMR
MRLPYSKRASLRSSIHVCRADLVGCGCTTPVRRTLVSICKRKYIHVVIETIVCATWTSFENVEDFRRRKDATR